MSSPILSTRAVRAMFVAAVFLATASQLAHAQGTDAEREACTPDAVRLCSDTIPDIPKTTACMKAHFRQLSPRCKIAFNAATEASPGASAAAPSAPAGQGAPAGSSVEAPVAPAPVPGSVAAYRADIARDCRQGLIDAFTCRSTLEVLDGLR